MRPSRCVLGVVLGLATCVGPVLAQAAQTASAGEAAAARPPNRASAPGAAPGVEGEQKPDSSQAVTGCSGFGLRLGPRLDSGLLPKSEVGLGAALAFGRGTWGASLGPWWLPEGSATLSGTTGALRVGAWGLQLRSEWAASRAASLYTGLQWASLRVAGEGLPVERRGVARRLAVEGGLALSIPFGLRWSLRGEAGLALPLRRVTVTVDGLGAVFHESWLQGDASLQLVVALP